MRITIAYGLGLTIDGILLSLDGNAMRVAVRNVDDAAEFRFRDGQWYSEYGDVVRLESILADPNDCRGFRLPVLAN